MKKAEITELLKMALDDEFPGRDNSFTAQKFTVLLESGGKAGRCVVCDKKTRYVRTFERGMARVFVQAVALCRDRQVEWREFGDRKIDFVSGVITRPELKRARVDYEMFARLTFWGLFSQRPEWLFQGI